MMISKYLTSLFPLPPTLWKYIYEYVDPAAFLSLVIRIYLVPLAQFQIIHIHLAGAQLKLQPSI